MPGFPAARLTDLHVCSMCPPPGLPVLPLPPIFLHRVLIGNMPAARQTDMCACIGPPPAVVDAIVFGSPTVLIGSLPAARQFDPTAKGGVVSTGFPTVLIGIVPDPPAGAPGALGPITEVTLPDGTVVTKIGPNITITGTKEFRDAVVHDMERLYGTPTGKSLIDSLNTPGKGPVNIVATTGGNKVDGTTAQGWVQPDGSNGTGSGSTLHYNPDRTQIGDGSEPWMTRPPAVALGHELVHVEQAQNGSWSSATTGGTENDELAAVGLPPYQGNAHTENKIRDELNQPKRPRY